MVHIYSCGKNTNTHKINLKMHVAKNINNCKVLVKGKIMFLLGLLFVLETESPAAQLTT